MYSNPLRGCSSAVERDLAKVEVEGSIPFTRFLYIPQHIHNVLSRPF